MILDLGMSLYSWPTIYDAGPALNKHSASSTQRLDFMRLSLRVRLRVRLRRVGLHKDLHTGIYPVMFIQIHTCMKGHGLKHCLYN